MAHRAPVGGSCELKSGKGSICNRCCACVIPAQPQREDSGHALSRDGEPVSARCVPPRLVSVQGPMGSEGACLKAGLTPPNPALGGFSPLPCTWGHAYHALSSSSLHPISPTSHSSYPTHLCLFNSVIIILGDLSISLSRTSVSPSVKWEKSQLAYFPHWADDRREKEIMKMRGF